MNFKIKLHYFTQKSFDCNGGFFSLVFLREDYE